MHGLYTQHQSPIIQYSRIFEVKNNHKFGDFVAISELRAGHLTLMLDLQSTKSYSSIPDHLFEGDESTKKLQFCCKHSQHVTVANNSIECNIDEYGANPGEFPVSHIQRTT